MREVDTVCAGRQYGATTEFEREEMHRCDPVQEQKIFGTDFFLLLFLLHCLIFLFIIMLICAIVRSCSAVLH